MVGLNRFLSLAVMLSSENGATIHELMNDSSLEYSSRSSIYADISPLQSVLVSMLKGRMKKGAEAARRSSIGQAMMTGSLSELVSSASPSTTGTDVCFPS